MKKELQQKIMNDHPLLYVDKDKSMMESCLFWGIETGSGWYDLIYDLSSKLEQEIREYAAKYPDIRCRCGCVKTDHRYGSGKCNNIMRVAYPKVGHGFYSHIIPKLKKLSVVRFIKQYLQYKLWDVKRRFNRLSHKFGKFLFDKFNIAYDLPCRCERYEPNYPRMAQIKEKYGELTVYLDGATDKMYELVYEASKKSLTICDECGGPGTLRTNGWWRTVCDSCEGDRG